MTTEWIHIGFGGVIATHRILAVAPPDSAPIKRLIGQARKAGKAMDMTFGRKTKAVILFDTGHVALAAIQPQTIIGRLRQQRERDASSDL